MITAQVERPWEDTLKDRLSAVFLLIMCGLVFWLTKDFPVSKTFDPGVAAWPQILAGVIALCALVPLVKPRVVEEFPAGTPSVRVVSTIAALVLYMVLFDLLGFVFSTTLYFVAQFAILKVTSWRVYLLIPLPLSLGLFFLFRKLLEVPLPLSGIGGLPV